MTSRFADPAVTNRSPAGSEHNEPLAVLVAVNYGKTVTDALRTFGRVALLGEESLRIGTTDALKLRFRLRDTLRQCWFLVSVIALPGVLMAVPFGVIVSVQVGNIVHELGANSLVGAASGLGIIRQGAPMATGLLLGGAGAAAIAADLGSRTIRDEIDALRVMGLNPVRLLVVPRIAAALVAAPLLNILVIFSGIVAGYLIAIGPQGVTPGSYWATFGSFTMITDIWISLVKSIVFGLIVAVIACHRGLEAKGGPRGVADAVNAAVVLSVLGILVANVAITQIVAMFLPIRVA